MVRFGQRYDDSIRVTSNDYLLWVVHDEDGVLGLYASAVEALAAAQTDTARWVVTTMPMPDIDPKAVLERISKLLNK